MTDYDALAVEAAAQSDDPKPDPITTSGLAALEVGANILDAAGCLRALVSLVNGADPLARRTLRNRAIAELKRARIADPSGMVDAALPTAKDETGDGQGQAVMLSDPILWPEPVDGAALMGALARTFARYLALPDGAATALALWVVHAHAVEAAFVSPLMVLASPEKRCGKTTTFKVLGALVPRRLPASSISPAALFRSIEKFRPTLLLDEADTAFRESEELRAIVNAGHDRDGAFVLRTVGDDHEPRAFSTWCPKAIALIGTLPGTLTDRAIVVPMRRRRRDEKVERLRVDRLADLEPLRSQAWRWTRDHLAVLREADPEVPASLNDRASDNWRPLLAVADAAGNPWSVRARRAACLLSGVDDGGEDAPGVLLLADLRTLFDERAVDRLATANILEHLHGMETRPWPEWGKQRRPISARGIAALLSRFKVVPGKWKDGPDTVRGYDRAGFEDAFSRYLPSDPPLPPPANGKTTYDDSASAITSDRWRIEEPRNPLQDNAVAAVANENGVLRQEGETVSPLPTPEERVARARAELEPFFGELDVVEGDAWEPAV